MTHFSVEHVKDIVLGKIVSLEITDTATFPNISIEHHHNNMHSYIICTAVYMFALENHSLWTCEQTLLVNVVSMDFSILIVLILEYPIVE